MRTRCTAAGVLTAAMFAFAGPANAEPIVLATHDLFPYGYRDADGNLTGAAVDVVSCALDEVGRPYEIRVVGWKRAQLMVQRDKFEGFFAASKNDERDGYAVLSAYVADQNWTWFIRGDFELDPGNPDFKETALVTSRHGANMQRWLKDNGYQVPIAPPTSVDEVAERLLSGEIDAALANEQVMSGLLATVQSSDIRTVLNLEKPLGVYFSKGFLDENPGFLERFNAAVPGCREAFGDRVYRR